MDDTAAAIAEQPAEAPDARAQISTIRLSRIKRSPTNPRKTFNQAHLDELTASVRQHGILQPLLVRPIVGSEDRFELIAGERRYRAAMAAELREVPALVRSMTDLQVLEVQLVENLQREGLHELEEAEGYDRLLQSHGYTIDDLRAKVGKSRSYVFQRLKLLDLCDAARKAFFAEKLSFSTALLIAPIPVDDLQRQALEEITSDHWDGGMSARAAADHIQRRYMLRLASAPFPRHDAGLVPEAGACSTCPKRTGNAPELFADALAADTCTDPECFDAKRKAHAERTKAEALERGQEVITGARAKKLGTDLVRLDDKDYTLTGAGKSYKDLLGKGGPTPVLVEAHDGSLVEALPRKALADALREKGHKVGGSRVSDDERKRVEAAKIETTVRRRLFDAVAPAIVARQHYDLKPIALAMWERTPNDVRTRLLAAKGCLASAHDWPDRIEAMPQEDVYILLHEISLAGELHVPSWSSAKPERLLAMAALFEIDVAAIRKAVTAEARAAEKAKAAKKPAKSDAPTSAPRGEKKAPKKAAAKPAPRGEAKGAKKPKAKAKAETKADPEVGAAVPAAEGAVAVGASVQVNATLPGRSKAFAAKYAGRSGQVESVFVDGRISVRFDDGRPGRACWLKSAELAQVEPQAAQAGTAPDDGHQADALGWPAAAATGAEQQQAPE